MASCTVTPIDRYRPAKLADQVEHFLASKARTLGTGSGKTIRAYRHDLARFPASFGALGAGAVNRDALERHLRDLTESDGAPVAPATANRHHATLCSFFSWLVDQGTLEVSPMKGIGKVRVPDAEPGALTEVARAAVLANAKLHGTREHALIALLLATGLRIAEALALDIADLHLEDLAVTVRQGKGGKTRRAFLTHEARTILKRYLREHPDRRPHAPVFITSRGRLSYPRAAALFKTIAEGVTNPDGSPLHLHQLRHTFATAQLGKGLNPAHLMTLTGHTDLRTLGRYTNAAKEAAAEAEFRHFNQ